MCWLTLKVSVNFSMLWDHFCMSFDIFPHRWFHSCEFWSFHEAQCCYVNVCTVCRTVQPTVGIDWLHYCYLSHLLAHHSVRVMMTTYVTSFILHSVIQHKGHKRPRQHFMRSTLCKLMMSYWSQIYILCQIVNLFGDVCGVVTLPMA